MLIGENPYVVLDIRSPEFPKFMGCGLRFLRDAQAITFDSLDDWDFFQSGPGKDLMPWLTKDGEVAHTFPNMAVGVTGTPLVDVDPNVILNAGSICVRYSARLIRAFNSRIAALEECGTKRDDWWDEVVIKVVNK